MSTMRLKNKDGTWDKVPVLGSYQAVLAANEAATNAQNAANKAEVIVGNLPYVTPQMYCEKDEQGNIIIPNDWADAIQKTFDENYSYKTIIFPKGEYHISRPINIPVNAKFVNVIGVGFPKIICDHNGDCLVLQQTDSEAGNCLFENLVLVGTNPAYGTLGDMTNQGAGFKLLTAYENKFVNCYASGFKYGLYIHIGIGNDFESGCYFRFNEYGAYFFGGATNLNRFTNCNIRENRVAGVYMTHDTADINYILSNTFTNCYIESNVPYLEVDRIDEEGNIRKDVGLGVFISGAMCNIFYGCYFEYNMWSVVLANGAQHNKFTDCYFTNNPNWNIFRFVGIVVKYNSFINCNQGSDVKTESIVDDTTDNNIDTNLFEKCRGFVFNTILANTLTPVLRDCSVAGAGNGTDYNKADVGEVYQNAGDVEVYNQPWIEGIGTNNAILHTKGFGAIQLASLIVANTTITKIDGMKKGQLLYIDNYQNSYKVTFKAGSTTNSQQLTLQNGDVSLETHGDNIVFYCTYTNNICEVSSRLSSRKTRTLSISKADIVTASSSTALYNSGFVHILVDITISSSIANWTDVLSINNAEFKKGAYAVLINTTDGTSVLAQLYNNNGVVTVRIEKSSAGQIRGTIIATIG